MRFFIDFNRVFKCLAAKVQYWAIFIDFSRVFVGFAAKAQICQIVFFSIDFIQGWPLAQVAHQRWEQADADFKL